MKVPRIFYRRSSDCFTLRSQLYDIQDRLCMICKKQGPLVLDHDHFTGLTRGLLCRQCNALLGFAKDNIPILQRAIEYLLHFIELGYQPLVTQPIEEVSRDSQLFIRNHTYTYHINS